MTKRLSACVYGRVQGVGFRLFVLRKACGANLAGYVRNTRGGAVEVVAEGEPVDLETLLDYLREGPMHARVDRLESRWDEPTGEFERFEVMP